MNKIMFTLDSAFSDLLNGQKRDNFNFIQRISIVEEVAAFEEKYNCLLRGYLVKKHSKSQSKSKHKFLYISEDLKRLCWKSLDKND